jgi:4,5-dihydroxyphthalate decarboxylase
MGNLRLTLALSEYAHTRDLVNGRIRPEGIELINITQPFEAIGLRFGATQEFDVAEFSLANFCALASQDAPSPMIGIPVFPSRAFRHSAIYVNDKSGIRSAADLAGRKVGLPQWSQTATVYVRGFLADDAGVPLTSIDWVQAGLNEAGRKEPVKLRLPTGIKITPAPDKSLSDMLAKGEIDAAITARPPDSFLQGAPGVRRLFPNFRQEEEAYFKRSGVFPIMHVIAVRRDVYEANRWVVRSLYDAFTAAKNATIPLMRNFQGSFLPTAWGPEHFDSVNDMLFPGGDPWPYGIEPNRPTLAPFLTWLDEQGVVARALKLEELFPKEMRFEVKV